MIDPGPERPATSVRPGPGTILIWASWFGLVGGLVELAEFLAKCHYLSPRNYNVSRQFPWMFPAATLAILAVPGGLLALGSASRRGRLPTALVVSCLAFPTWLGVLFRLPVFTVACLLLAAVLAYRTAATIQARASSFDQIVRRSLPFLIGAPVAAFAADQASGIWMASRTAPPAPGGPNVLLIVLDTVRAESLSLYGYGRPTSPNLARYADRGVRFDLAFSTAPWTAPSHAGMFTGRPATELSIGWDRPLDRTTPTLAAHLADRGYATAGFVANTTYCSYETGLARGFARYEDYDVAPGSILQCSSLVQRTLAFVEKHPGLIGGELGPTTGHRKDAGRINADFLDWLSDRPADRPFFGFLNYYDAHHPYFPPGPVPGRGFGRLPETGGDYRLLRDWWASDKRDLPARDVELARDAYDRCIAYLDHQVGRLLDDLDRRGVLRDTLVVITSDHGEHLGEQHLFGHGTSLYRPELHVPLILLPPAGFVPGGEVVREPVSLGDLPATVLDFLPRTVESPFPGRSLKRRLGTLSGEPRTDDDPVRSDVAAAPEDDPNHGLSPAARGPMTSLIAWGHHYIHQAEGREELFDLAADPGEASDLLPLLPDAAILARFRARLKR